MPIGSPCADDDDFGQPQSSRSSVHSQIRIQPHCSYDNNPVPGTTTLAHRDGRLLKRKSSCEVFEFQKRPMRLKVATDKTITRFSINLTSGSKDIPQIKLTPPSPLSTILFRRAHAGWPHKPKDRSRLWPTRACRTVSSATGLA